jgi:hypothetical protein
MGYVWIAHLRHGPNLSPEAGHGSSCIVELRVKYLDRDLPLQSFVLGQIDYTHSTAAQRLQDSILVSD